MAPWGVAELDRLGLHDVLLGAGGGHVTRFVGYDETLLPEEAEARALSLADLLPGVPGALDVGHPAACEALAQAAVAAGATLVRGVGAVTVMPGTAPAVTYEHDDIEHQLPCRLVIGADARMSSVRRQIGINLHETTPRTWGAGLLVEGLTEWPAEVCTMGNEHDLVFLVFPRPEGRARLYLLWNIAADKVRFTGPNRQREFLDAFRLRCLPLGEALAASEPAGPIASYPMNDSWCEEPLVEGVVLVGDAAGWNDPIIGQGLSISLRDARLVSEVLAAGTDWSPAAFRPYSIERGERMRRLRFSARLVTELRATFTPEGAARRKRFFERASHKFLMRAPILGTFLGPESMPAAAFDAENLRRCLAA
jgi:2-polyprenyl-6-methoxyphenol hydroxylase-like FAD-dependent oxidoreductase